MYHFFLHFKIEIWEFLAFQLLGFCTFTAKAAHLSPGQGTKILTFNVVADIESWFNLKDIFFINEVWNFIMLHFDFSLLSFIPIEGFLVFFPDQFL